MALHPSGTRVENNAAWHLYSFATVYKTCLDKETQLGQICFRIEAWPSKVCATGSGAWWSVVSGDWRRHVALCQRQAFHELAGPVPRHQDHRRQGHERQENAMRQPCCLGIAHQPVSARGLLSQDVCTHGQTQSHHCQLGMKLVHAEQPA